MIETIKQDERLYTKRQVEAAAMRSRRVDGIDITIEDVVRAYEIYGPDLQAVRGKTAEKKVTLAPAKEKIVDSRVIP
jgi:hypothetical protein